MKTSRFELPLLTTHRAKLLGSLAIEPLHYTMDMKTVRALTPNQWTIVAGQFTIGTTGVKGHSTNATRIIVG